MPNTALPKASLMLAAALTLACSETPVAPEASGRSSEPALDAVANGVVAHVSVGSNDICEAFGLKPGCDANFSLVANKWADGTVRGQWEDQFGKDASGEQLGGVHVEIDCLVAVPLQIYGYDFKVAWVSGVVTQSTSPYYSVGDGVITGAVDRGTSENDPFADLTSFTIPLSQLPPGTTCEDMPGLPVFIGYGFTGQVDIWYR